jgi:Fic family protein
VAVGAHVAPGSEALPGFLARFQEAYRPDRLRGTEQVIAAAASHHRLTWIHPFLDGNGRVARLFSHAYLTRIGVAGHGLWTVTRGLARDQQAYLAALAAADARRQGDLDGRGNLSNRTLVAFCRFFLGAALDQIDFMSSLLELGALERRVQAYSERLVAQGLVRREATLLLRDVLVRGEVARGEAGRITGTGERVARQIVSSLTARRLLESETPKGPVHLGFPAEAVSYYFPRLYPAGVELGEEDRGSNR